MLNGEQTESWQEMSGGESPAQAQEDVAQESPTLPLHVETAPITPASRPSRSLNSRPTSASHQTRRLEDAQAPHKQRHTLRMVALFLLWIVLFATVAEGVDAGIQVYNSISRARIHASDAMRHLNALRALIPATASSGNLSALAPLLTESNLNTAKTELSAAAADFQAIKVDLAPVGVLGVAGQAPVAGDALTATRLLADAGDHGCQAGLLLIGDAQNILAYLKGGFFADGKGTGLTSEVIAMLHADLNSATADLDLAVADIKTANLNAIPSSLLKPSYVTLLRTFAAKWPTERARLAALEPWLAVAPSLIGAGSPSSYLIEIMDSNELRPGGGFIGNYTIFTLSNGRAEPFTLQDTYLLDRPYLAHVGVALAPAQYAWWPWQTYFGLRDSNLSPDFPTNARLAMHMLVAEGGPNVQGVIAITPTTIQRVLKVVGSIPMPLYNVTVTSDNLVSLIEHYQLAVSPQTNLPVADQISSPSKRFVALLGRALLDSLHKLSLSQMLSISLTFATDVQQKDVQIYFANANAEALLTKLGYDAAIAHTPGDAVTINDANDGVNKANEFTTATYQDKVSLDAQGNATHNLTITYRFHAPSLALLYGPDLYKTYLRIYTPANAHLLSLTGLNNLYGADQINHSDMSQRQMWGGYVIVSDSVPYTLHVVWVVPHVALRDNQGHWRYTLVYQRQAGAKQVLDVTINVPGQKNSVASFSGALLTDETLSAS